MIEDDLQLAQAQGGQHSTVQSELFNIDCRMPFSIQEIFNKLYNDVATFLVCFVLLIYM